MLTPNHTYQSYNTPTAAPPRTPAHVPPPHSSQRSPPRHVQHSISDTVEGGAELSCLAFFTLDPVTPHLRFCPLAHPVNLERSRKKRAM